MEDTANARATKLKTDANSNLSFESSDSDGYSGLYSVFYYFFYNTTVEDMENPIELYEYTYSSRKWNKGSRLYTFPYEEDHDGVILRENRNRVRCIYNPDPPTPITVNSEGKITYIDGEAYNP